MGAVIGSLLGGVTMGVTSSALNCICFVCPWGASTVAKYLHLTLLIIALTVALLWRVYADAPIAFPAFPSLVDNSIQEQARYFGPWAICIGVLLYHGLQALLLVGVRSDGDKRSIIQSGAWPIKVFVMIGAVATAFMVPVRVYQYMFYFGIVGSALYLALQSVYLVDFAYRGAELMVEKYEESEGVIWKYSLFGVTGLLYLLSLVMSGLTMYFHFQELLIVAIVNIILTVVVSVCSVLEEVQEANPQAGIFQAAFISFYNSFLLVVSSMAQVEEPSTSSIKTAVYVFSGFLFIAGLGYYAVTIGVPKGDDSDLPDSVIEKGLSVDESDTSLEYSMSFFHIYLMLAALYSITTITCWRKLETIPVVVDGKEFRIGGTSVTLAKWTPLVSSWLLTALYLWSLFAPLIFADREFT
jgi:hypothetical protein